MKNRFHFGNIVLSIKLISGILLLFASFTQANSQPVKKPEDFGFRYLKINFKGDPVDVLIKSAKGDEQKKKPLFFFCQGSLPVPLIVYGKEGVYGTFPFNADSLAVYYHVVIASKPYVPVVAEETTLQKDLTYTDETKKPPVKYIQRNLLSYYVARDLAIIDSLQKKSWVSNKKLVVAGHSEGSAIAAKLAYQSKKVTHLIYSGGNPFGRMSTIINRNRMIETDSLPYAENSFKTWEAIVKDPGNMNVSNGDPSKTTFEFSEPLITYLQKLTIPVFVTYGSKDVGSVPFNDYFRMEMIRQKKNNFSFKAYIGTEHNFFGVKQNGEPDYDKFNWDKVVADWLNWLRIH